MVVRDEKREADGEDTGEAGSGDSNPDSDGGADGVNIEQVFPELDIN